MEKVLGIGGLFFRADSPSELAAWYAQHLGIDVVPQDYDTRCWQQAGGSTVFAPFDASTDYFGRQEQQWMVNFRVRDLDAMAEQLRGAGIAVEVDETVQPNGRFGRLSDPAGNPIELWEPADEKDRREP